MGIVRKVALLIFLDGRSYKISSPVLHCTHNGVETSVDGADAAQAPVRTPTRLKDYQPP